MTRYMPPRTYDPREWENFIGRALTKSERRLFMEFRSEVAFNRDVKSLQDNISVHNLHIPVLTNLHGNCLFESLEYHNLTHNHEEFRKALGYFLVMFRHQPNFFHNQPETLNQLFDTFNEIETVLSRDDNKFYKYNYDCMCHDIVNECTWTRLPTQLILMFISKLFHICFVIYNDQNDWKNEINCIDPEFADRTRTIYLGHIGEFHYVPLDIINPDDQSVDYSYKYYYDAYHELKAWGRHYINKIQKN